MAQSLTAQVNLCFWQLSGNTCNQKIIIAQSVELKGKSGKTEYPFLHFSEARYIFNQLLLDRKSSTFHFVKAIGREKAGRLVKG